MSENNGQDYHLTEEGVREDLQRQPYVLMRLVENAFIVAENLRGNYFENTSKFIKDLRKKILLAKSGESDPIISISNINGANWQEVQGEVVTFIDGGVGQVEISGQIPILLRVGSYAVRTGERNLAEREQFGYYPVILGDLEGGSKERKDFIDIVRITAELLGGLSALKRTPNLRLLMFHGPLMYLMGNYAGHSPFTENDIDLFLRSYAANPQLASDLKNKFLEEARIQIYPKLAPGVDTDMIQKKLFDPLAWMAFLYQQLISEAKKRSPVPIIAGVVERGRLREFSEDVLLERIFVSLRKKNNQNYFNNLFGRTDLKTPGILLDRLAYTDAILMAMLMKPGQRSESWIINKLKGLRTGQTILTGEARATNMDWSILKDPLLGFPKIKGCYISVSDRTEPIRVEVFECLGEQQIEEAAKRAYLYSLLIPGYGFPVGLDVADKFAKVPTWLTNAYSKLIKHHLSVSLQKGEIKDAEMRHLLVQAIYMTHRDWLFRPNP
ncbi:hypothetical protein AAE02nite_38220 [Adhaeribacter aerolatus]|uniref:NurA domain-containing protein n=1 Tax=Adhaeribacter aerolatus TaxID=670289 RepID=A0A512B2I4_9BACT|nr:DNA double-strand break repair nuclease NurA [Adhaeribacter aerolatus]GEO06158.1 hypothetical protein AAE02nite_38220 [Adhaeribacter aerolatus]